MPAKACISGYERAPSSELWTGSIAGRPWRLMRRNEFHSAASRSSTSIFAEAQVEPTRPGPT